MKNKALELYLERVANDISKHFFDHPWFPHRPHVTKSPAGKVIHSIFLLERAGFNTGDKDWVAAVQGERFTVRKETVAHILAYPPSESNTFEPRKLLNMLGIAPEDSDNYCLYCDIYIGDIVAEQIEMDVWKQVALIVANIRSESREEAEAYA